MATVLSAESMTFLYRLILAAFLGALIGLERDVHGRAAGLRTHLLVSMGAAVFVMLSELIASFGRTASGTGMAVSDPGRIAAQVVTGIGFLGAGTIIKEGLTIRGLTTAACLWVVAGIGMASGAGYYKIAIAATSVSLCCLIGLRYFERLYQKDAYRTLAIVTNRDVGLPHMTKTIKSKRMQVISFDLERDYVAGLTTIRLYLSLFHRGLTEEIPQQIIKSLEKTNIPLKSVTWNHR
jgi:putative Mg2+ transporter-C (MgtC) family protein